MKKLILIVVTSTLITLCSCTEKIEVIKEVEVTKSNLPDSLELVVSNQALLNKYKLIIDSVKSGYFGSVPDFFIVSYGNSRNSYSSQLYNPNYTGYHLSIQFFKYEKRYFFITRKIKDLSRGNEYAVPETTVLFNQDFYTSTQFVYQIIQTYN